MAVVVDGSWCLPVLSRPADASAAGVTDSADRRVARIVLPRSTIRVPVERAALSQSPDVSVLRYSVAMQQPSLQAVMEERAGMQAALVAQFGQAGRDTGRQGERAAVVADGLPVGEVQALV